MRGLSRAAVVGAVAAAVGMVAGMFVGCGGGDGDRGAGYYNGYRTGAACSAAGTCPPGQICDADKICRRPCTRPGPCQGQGGPCECDGNASCDVDLLCRPICSVSNKGPSEQCGTSVGGGANNCGAGQACDPDFDVCRPVCRTAAACSASTQCITPRQGCPFCRPRPATGQDGGVSCSGPGLPEGGACAADTDCAPCLRCLPGERLCRRSCTAPGCSGGGGCECNADASRGEVEVCDVDGYCRPSCGWGGPSSQCSGGRPNCPSGLTCDIAVNVCRPACVGTRCPAGFICEGDAKDPTCRLCRPIVGGGGGSDGGAGG